MSDSTRFEELLRWRKESIVSLEKAQAQLAELQAQIHEERARLELLDRLVAIEGGDKGSETPPTTEGDSLVSACEALIRQAGRPLHISELHRELLSRGVPIPGKGAEANIIVRLQRADGLFVRTGRGLYGLRGFGVEEVRPVKRRKRPQAGGGGK